MVIKDGFDSSNIKTISSSILYTNTHSRRNHLKKKNNFPNNNINYLINNNIAHLSNNNNIAHLSNNNNIAHFPTNNITHLPTNINHCPSNNININMKSNKLINKAN